MARLGFVLLFAIIASKSFRVEAIEVNEAVLEDGANGTAVVLLSITHIQQAAIFPDDNEMLRRIAYVETRDGSDPDTYSDGNNGGIWAVSEVAFKSTKDTTNSLLALKHEQINQQFGIVWGGVPSKELRKPLYSALAARLVLFVAPRAIPSGTDITAQARFWRENYNSAGLVDDFIGATNELKGAVLESSASDFYVGFARNDVSDPSVQQLFITTREPDPVPFTVQTLLGFYFTGVAIQNTTTVVSLGSSYQVFSSAERSKGIHISAGDKSIVVYGLNYEQFTSDAFLALPCSRLAVDQYEYYGMTYDNTRWNSQLLFVGCEDNTTIHVASTTITLNRMETYLLETSNDNTGTRVISNKPVSFFSGTQCTNIPSNQLYCDHTTEQFPPTAIWGTHFLSASFSGRMSGDIYRVLTSQPSTTVTVNCTTYSQPQTYSLATAGSWQEFNTPTNSFCVIESNNPLLVVEFGLANQYDGIGDPFMMMIPPIEQYSNDYVFNVLPEFETNYITVLVSPQHFQPEKIFVDDISPEGVDWTAIYCADGRVCGHAAYANLEAGEHRVYHSDTLARVGVAAYGFNLFNSYGYPGGLHLSPIQLATVSFSQATYSVGENEQTLIASVVRSGDMESFVVVLIANHPYEGTATAGQDYTSLVKVLEFEPGVTTKNVTINIIDDKLIEVDESFVLYLTSGAGAFLSPFAQAEVTIINNDGKIQLNPHYGNQLGGAPIIVSGTDVTFSESDNITCIFDDQKVKGVYVSEEQALCVSPELSQTGTVLFQLLQIVRVEPGGLYFSGEATFISLPYEKAYEVLLQSEEPVFETGSIFTVYWSPQSIFSIIDAKSYTIDITMREFNTDTGEWSTLALLASDLPNNGEAKITIPELPTVENIEDSITLVVVEVGVSSASVADKKRSLFSTVLSEVARFGLRIQKQTSVWIRRTISRQDSQHSDCEKWANNQPNNIGREINNQLPSCPCTADRAQAPNSGFKEERFLSVIAQIFDKVLNTTIIEDTFNYIFQDPTIVDDVFRKFFHSGTASCYRQRKINPSRSGDSGQQCCYDARGDIVGPPGGGTVDLVSPEVNFSRHFSEDVKPFLYCCIYEQNCETYYRYRPSDNCSRSESPPLPARARGDPHFVTLDGYKYTFNGRGEFILIETPDDSFTLQGRMVDIVNVNGTAASATVFSAIVARERKSDIVQFEILADDSIAAFVNGEEVDFSIVEQDFNNVTVADLGNNSLSAAFSSGAYLEVKQENGIISSLVISLPESYKNTETKGLLGMFNGDTTDDLQPKLRTSPLPLNSTLQEIHEYFGLTWIIDTPGGSMFSYQPGESWATYYDPYFQPEFQPGFGNADLELEATRLCEGDKFCLFDIAATGNIELGLSTHQTSQEIEALEQLSLPIICNPPCQNGACVANDTCACFEGFSGDACAERIVMECEENPCENGGTCTKHVNDFTCTCPPEYSGFLCEDFIGTILVNDTLTGDPLMTVPLLTTPDAQVGDERISLCYEVHGAAGKVFSLISDECTAVNAHYVKAALNSTNLDLNVVDAIGVRTVGDDGVCRNISVGLSDCQATVDGVGILGAYRMGGIGVREYNERVRITVPNCANTSLVMWVFCMNGIAKDPMTRVNFPYRMIRFVVTRGLNLNEQSHGIIGQFWNVPIDVEEYDGNIRGSARADDYIVTVRYPGSVPRRFYGLLYSITWEHERQPCIYAGDSQAGPSNEVGTPNDSIIEGRYIHYEVDSMFATDFLYSHFEADRC